MQCPYCTTHFHFDFSDAEPSFVLTTSEGQGHRFMGGECPACEGLYVIHARGKAVEMSGYVHLQRPEIVGFVYPRYSKRKKAVQEVPDPYAADYNEACLVVDDSPKASAALSRRCLQSLIEEHFGIKERTLDKEIENLLSTNKLPSYIAEVVDAVRTVGNFAAHPTKNQHTGEIADVEPGEAEWLLDVLDSLFEFCFVQPAIQQQKRAALNAKLLALGKPALKS